MSTYSVTHIDGDEERSPVAVGVTRGKWAPRASPRPAPSRIVPGGHGRDFGADEVLHPVFVLCK